MKAVTVLCCSVLASFVGVSQTVPSGTVKPNASVLRDQMRSNLLAKYDSNKNGKLDPSEKAIWQRDLAQMRADKSSRFDANRDGKLDSNERAAAQAWLTGQATPPVQPPTPPQRPKMSQAESKAAREAKNADMVRRHDKDGDGTLSQEEKDAMWTEWRLKLREKKAATTGAPQR